MSAARSASAGMAAAADAAEIPGNIVDEAIAWAVRLDFNVPTPQGREAFARWLAASPLHAAAWGRVQSLNADFARLPARLAHDTLDAADALRAARARQRRDALRALAFGSVALAAGWSGYRHAPWQRLVADYSTATGERRTIALADGTVVVLNTDSAVDVRMDSVQRRITLRRGEMLVTTGHDAQARARRPFWVGTPFGAMQALGTRFTVRLYAADARISVQEGAVQLHPATGLPADPGAPIVHAGQSGRLGADGASLVPAPAADPAGWVDGVIAARGMRLDALLAELARYRSGHVGCDARVAALPVSGVFQLGDTDATLQFLVQTLPVKVRFLTRFWVMVGPDGTA
ncbi:FecR domain-containing protein [Cupriavidus sp. 30B13]|uniref:FecR domain-containing protein n=1 Tax=Cupriavidus sp. 30B13 TaxID=3384241 RepID=UPI003B90D4E9